MKTLDPRSTPVDPLYEVRPKVQNEGMIISEEKAVLSRLLAERNQNPDRIEAIDLEIRRRFERKVSMLVLDMSGFSRLAAKHGIIHYLAMIAQMENVATPAVTGNRGTVLKQEADNLFAVFDHPGDALAGALDIFRAFAAINTVLTDDRDIYGSIGIGYGDTLVIGKGDLFGSEMNLASKLGEDLAERSEILLTQSAYAGLVDKSAHAFERVSYEAGGIAIVGYKYIGADV